MSLSPCDAYTVVFALNDLDSFHHGGLSLRHLREELGTDRAIILVGNKSDLVRQRRVNIKGRESGTALHSRLRPLFHLDRVSGCCCPVLCASVTRVGLCLSCLYGGTEARDVRAVSVCARVSRRGSLARARAYRVCAGTMRRVCVCVCVCV